MAPRTYVSDFTLQFGAATTRGKLVPIKLKDTTPKPKYCTPDGKPVVQYYLDEDGNKYTQSELHRAVEEDGELRYIGDAETVAAATASDLPPNVMSVTPHPHESVGRYLFPSDNQAYQMIPGVKSTKGEWIGRGHAKVNPAIIQWFDFIYTMVRESGAVFLGMCKLGRANEALYKLDIYQDNLIVHKQLFPEELAQLDALAISIDPAIRQKGLEVVRAKLTEFEPNEYRSTKAERLAQLVAEDYDPAEPLVRSLPSEIDLLSALDAI